MFQPNQYPKIQAVFISLIAIVWSSYAYTRGIIFSPDSGTYSRFANILVENNFNVFDYLDNAHATMPVLFYYIWVAILAVNKVLLGENWGLGIVILNLLAGISVATLLFKTTWAITGKPACVILTGLFLLFCHEFYLWIPFVLSDTLFSSLCFLIFILITSLCQQPADLSKSIAGIVILLCIALFFRPSWPPLLIFSVLSIPLTLFSNLIAADPGNRHKFIIRCALFTCIFIPIIIFCHSYLMINPDKWPFSFLSKTVTYIAGDYLTGSVIYGHPETYHSPPNNILDYAFISLHKLFAFFYIEVASYSFKHTLFNYIFFLPLYGLSILAITRLFKKDNGPSSSNWFCIFYCALFIFLFAFFHSLEQIDFDFRYRLPVILPLIFLAALGLNELINGFSKKT
jgi:hypothetical protein